MRIDLLRDEKLLTGAPARAARRRGVLLFPQSYAVGMASLALHTLYSLLNEMGDMAWERAFVDPARDSTRSHGVCSLESNAPLHEFDVIAVTSSYELDWPAIPSTLEGGGVPALRRTRREVRSPVLVIAGGPAISAAPLPLSELYDAAFVGEMEPAADELRAALAADDPADARAALAAIAGCYVPELHGELQPGSLVRRCARHLDDFETASSFLTPHSEFPNRFLVEMGRGCGRSCSFCLARQIYRPLRWRSLPRLMQTIRRGLQHTNDLGLIAAAVSDYPELPELCLELASLPPEVSISTSSIRLESATPELLRLLTRSGQRTVTYAPEAATERLRDTIGKTLSDDAIFAAVDRAAAAGVARVRLYLMLGLPGELPEDREAIGVLGRRLTEAFPSLTFRFSIGAFSPRPHTPFEMEPVAPTRELRSWLALAQRNLKPLRRVEVSTDSARWGAMQAAMSRSDQRLGIALARDGTPGYTELVQRLAEEGLVLDELIGRPDPDGWLPWKVVDPRCVD